MSASQETLAAKTVKALRNRLYPAVSACKNTLSARTIRQQNRHRSRKSGLEIIRVGFIAQMPEVWDKQLSLFRYMMDHPRFDPRIIYVHPYDLVQGRVSDDSRQDRQFYEALYGRELVLDYSSEPSFDLSRFDYLFYDRPYNHYLPGPLQTRRAAASSRLCMINYGADDWDIPFDYPDFAAGISLWFASNTHEYLGHQAIYGKNSDRQCFDVGYPAYEYYHSLVSLPGRNRILWTPRWSYDEGIGGSHFLEYLDQWIAFVRKRDVSLVIRPHPLLFENLIRTNRMTEQELQNVKERCADAGIRFDRNRVIADTFRETDILVSDYSSVLGPFLTMDKPIVFCPGNIPLNGEFKKQESAMYHADSWTDVEDCLERILSGQDPMKEKRQEVITSCLLKKRNAVKTISDILVKDCSAEG